MMRLQRIEAEDRTRIEMKGVKFEVSEYKKSVEKFLKRMNPLSQSSMNGIWKEVI